MKNRYLAKTCCIIGATIISQLSIFAQENVMSDKYNAYWNDSIQQVIDANIEKYRKADATIVLENVKPGTEVTIKQTSSDFLFGSNSFQFDQFDTPEKNQKYRNVFGDLFNAATVAFYWKTLEPEKGHPRYTADSPFESRRPAPDPVVDYMESRGINMNGHTIIYGLRQYGHPEWMPEDRKEMEAYFEAHIRELAERYQGRVNRWDVVNEAYDQAERGLMPDDYTYKCYLWAMKYFPDNVQFNSNETDLSWGATPRYVEQVRNLIDRGIRINNMGIQSHMYTPETAQNVANGADYLTPQRIMSTLDYYMGAERPIHISEVTIPAPDGSEKSQQIQSILVRNLYRIWFSHPAVMGITWWNLVDGGAVPSEPSFSGLFDKDMNPKPAYNVLYDLIHNQWCTNLTLKAPKDGTIQFRGFKGDYLITWKDRKGHEQSMTCHVR